MTTPEEGTPSTPDVDQPQGGDEESGRTPDAPDVDQPDGGAEDGTAAQ